MKDMRIIAKFILINVSIIIFACITVIICGEVGVRLYQKLFQNVPFFLPTNAFEDAELGWKGKKTFGDPTSDRFKIFIVGDSFTHGMGVKEKDMYYEIFKKHSNAELFVYAGNGYGTLQEWMVINRFFNSINPDLVILQVSSNDFVNNHPQLEFLSFENNNLGRRPFSIQGHVQYDFPFFGGAITYFFATHSRFVSMFIMRIHMLLYLLSRKGLISTVERTIEEKGRLFQPFQESVESTRSIINKMKDRIGDNLFVAFTADYAEPYTTEFKIMFDELQIPFIVSIPSLIKQKSLEGETVMLRDLSHWNEAGHKLAGQVLAEALKDVARIFNGAKS